MTKAAALYKFFSSLLPAYPAESVPTGEDRPEYPYLTYTFSTAEFDTKASITLQLWYRGESWVPVNAKAEEISKGLMHGGKILNTDDGYIWLTKGSPFAQSMGDDNDNMVKRKVINIDAEYLTPY